MEDNARTKIELMKPVFLKAGIPIAISVAGFILARFTLGQKNTDFKDSVSDLCSDQRSCHDDVDIIEGDHNLTNIHDMYSLDSFHTQNRQELEEEIICLKGKIQDLQGREFELKFRFLHYLEMKDQEMELMELENCLSLEIAKSEFLDRELSSMEAETKRFEGMVLDFLKLPRQLQISRLENEVLHKRITRLLRKAKERHHVLERKNKQIEAGQADILQNHIELNRRADRISVLENKLLELTSITEKQEAEKNELMNKLNLAERSSLKTEDGTTWEGYNQLVNEFEQLERDRAAEVKELVYLRWCNACLRHQLIRRNQEQRENVEGKNSHQLELCFEENGLEGESESPVISDDHGKSNLECTTPSRDHAHAHSKRPKLIEKFKRWVEGSEKTKRKSEQKEKHDEVAKCFGKHFVSDGAEEIQVSARNSCSSAYHNSPNGFN